jgi:Acyl-CoA reductase (LuxC)
MNTAQSEIPASACWLHPDLQAEIDRIDGGAETYLKHYERNEGATVSFQRLSATAFRRMIAFVRERRDAVLMRRSVNEIVEVLDRAAEKWLEPSYHLRRRAVKQISAITGFSPEMVAHSIDQEQSSSRGPHLLDALWSELGDPAYLDGFQYNSRLGGYSRAIGPRLVGAIFSSNIPALPHLEVMRSFLVKAACLGRVSAGEPIFLSLYAQTLMEIDPDIASCLAVVYWERDDSESESAFLESIDYLVAYGGDGAISKLLSAKPPALNASWHGHGVGLCYVTKDALSRSKLDALADKIAYDHTIFDGFACLSPQVCLVEEGGEVTVQEFAEVCASKMTLWAEKLPGRSLTLSEAALSHKLRELYLMRNSIADGVRVISSPDEISFMVVMERLQHFEPSSGDRYLRIVPIGGLDDVERLIRPLKNYLQNAAVATADYQSLEYFQIREKFAAWGINRVVPVGIMGRPSMMWRHDGIPCLGRMIKWCDNELVSPDLLLARD